MSYPVLREKVLNEVDDGVHDEDDEKIKIDEH